METINNKMEIKKRGRGGEKVILGFWLKPGRVFF